MLLSLSSLRIALDYRIFRIMIVAYLLNFLVVPFYLSPSFVWKSLRSILPHNEWDRAISVITTGRSSSCKERTTNYMSECMHVCSCSYSVFSTRTFIHYSFIRFTCRNSKVVIQKHIVSYQGGLIYMTYSLLMCGCEKEWEGI